MVHRGPQGAHRRAGRDHGRILQELGASTVRTAQSGRALGQASKPTDPDGQVLHGRLAGARAGRDRCDRCGQVIPRHYGVCPACLEKGKLLFRLLGYAQPHWKLIALSLLLMVVATTIA